MHVDWNRSDSFSWLKALGHTVAIGLGFLLPAVAVSAIGGINATKAGEFAGGFIVPALILGWAWSWARQRRHQTLAHGLLFILVAMSAYEVFVLVAATMSSKEDSSAVSSLETRPPTSHDSAGGSVLCQNDIGLKLPVHPFTLTAAPDLARTLRQKDPNDAVARWAYREASGDIVVLMAAHGFDSKESLQSFAKGVSTAAAGRMTTTAESVEWSDGYGTLRVSLRQGDEARLDARCVSAANGNLVCIQTLGSGVDTLEPLRAALALGKCP
jgi:hypothetical protein